MNILSALSGRKEIENPSCSPQLFSAYEYQCTEFSDILKDKNEKKNSSGLSFQSPNKPFVYL